MKQPSYQELQNKVKELEQIIDMKMYPHEFYFETIDLHYFRMTEEWHFDFVNGKIIDLIGYDVDDLISRKISWLDIVHPEDRQLMRDAVARAMESDKYYIAEPRVVKKDGSIRWVKIRGRVICSQQGNLLFLQGVLNDITTQKYTEMALESEHQVFEWVADSMENAMYIVSGDYQIKFMNKALIELVGDHQGEVCYQALFGRDSVCPWSVMDVIRQETCGFQEYHLPQLGKTFQVRSFPIKSRDGSIGKLGHWMDITKTRQLQSEMQEVEARRQAIEDAANMAEVGVFIIQDHGDMEGRFRHTNQAFCRITGYAQEELLNMRAVDVVHPDDRQAALERYRRRRSGEILSHVYEIKLVRKDGVAITALFSVAPSSYEGKPAIVGFVRDITERKKAQKSLLISQRLASIGKLAAEIAHEMNNPLTSVLTFAKLVERIVQQEPFPAERLPDLRQAVGYLHGEATRCANIARNLLDFSRQGDIEIKENDVHEILQKTLNIFRHRAQLHGIEIATNLAPDIPRLFCDFKRLQQAFVNIISNAIEAMPDGGRLTVATALDSQQNTVNIHISDTGLGIPKENLERIFEPFFTTKAEGKGVGLGLSVAYGTIRQHRGKIDVQSEVGHGTRFTIQLRADLRSPWETDGNEV